VENEFAALLAACENPALKALLVVAYRQGLRRTELANLRWAAVDLERQILHVADWVTHWLEALKEKAGVDDCSIHDLRAQRLVI
jgi:site-specific recombinase XerC